MASKKNHSNHQEEEQPDLAIRVTEHPYFQLLVEYKTYLPYVSVGILVMIFLAFRFFTGQTAATESNYLLAENYFSMIQRSIQGEARAGTREQALNKLKAITEAYPELHSRYDPLIAQLLINQGHSEEATPYAERTFTRTGNNNLPDYTDFAQSTLLIADGQHAEALEKAIALKEHLLAQTSQVDASTETRGFGDTLFAYNLLRIAMLKKELGTPEEELEAWNEWTHYATPANTIIGSEAFLTLNEQVGEDNFSLQQYIDIRKKEISDIAGKKNPPER